MSGNQTSSRGIPKGALGQGFGQQLSVLYPNTELPVSRQYESYEVGGNGNGEVTAITPLPKDRMFRLHFTGAVKFIHSPRLLCPGSANASFDQGDTAIVRSEGDGSWRLLDKFPAVGRVTSINGAVGAVFVSGRNRLINGQFIFNQRGVGPADNAYAPDRWRTIGEFSAGANLYPDNYNTAGGNVPGIAMQFTGTADKGGFFQIIEGRNCKDLRGKTVTLSMLMLVSDVRLGNMKIGILEWTGTEDATSADPIASWGADGVTPTPATNWTFKNTPANLSVTTASALYSTTVRLGTTFNNLAVMIWNDDKAYTANDNFSVTNVQLEEEGVATPFDQRGYGEELRRCTRYCLALGSNGGVAYELFATGNVSSSTNFYASIPFAEKMRAVPALIASAASEFVCAAGGGVAVGSALSLSVSSTSAAQLALTTSGLTAGQAGSLQANNTAAAKLVFDAEL